MKRTLFVSNLRSEDLRFLCRTPRMREAPEAVWGKAQRAANFSSKLSTAPRAFAHLKNSSLHCAAADSITWRHQSVRYRGTCAEQWRTGSIVLRARARGWTVSETREASARKPALLEPCSRLSPLAAGPLLLQHDCPALIKANNAERVLADVDANPRCPICNVNHGGICSYMVAGLRPNASTGPNTKAERD